MNFEALLTPKTRHILSILGSAQGKARIVGGAVRNHIMGKPVDDIDIATEYLPHEVIDLLTQAGIRTIPTGLAHGTITALMDGQNFEVTTLRADVETTGRHAQVQFGTDWRADAQRRDFTMNALYVGLDGILFDPLNGLADIHAWRVRFIGDAATRIREDYLRILRYFRFCAHYSPEMVLSFDVAQAISCHINGLRQLSKERVWQELRKTLAVPEYMHVLADMAGLGIFTTLGLGIFRGYEHRHCEETLCDEAIKSLEKLDCHTSLRSVRNYALTRLFLHFIWLEEDAARIGVQLKLSNVDNNTLVLWAQHVWRLRTPPEFHTARELLYRVGAQTYAQIAYLASVRWGWALTIEILNIPTTHPIPPKPFTAQQFIDQGYIGAELGVKLKEAEHSWIDKGFI